jgi:glycine cleavage system H lipoate-binding protein
LRAKISKNSTAAVIEATPTAAALGHPVSGTVAWVNPATPIATPASAPESHVGSCWLLVSITLTIAAEVEQLHKNRTVVTLQYRNYERDAAVFPRLTA